MKYKVELVWPASGDSDTGISDQTSHIPDLIKTITQGGGKFFIISKWNWLGGGGVMDDGMTSPVLVIDVGHLSLAQPPNDPVSMPKSPYSPPSSRKRDGVSSETIRGTIRAVSGFLRIKSESDPFNESFVVHALNGERDMIFIFRKNLSIAYSFLSGHIGASIGVSKFKRIKLSLPKTAAGESSKTSPAVYMSQPDSELLEAIPPIIPHVEDTCRVRVIRINADGSLWCTHTSDTKPCLVYMHLWGKCDRRIVMVGAVLKIINFHMIDYGGIKLMVMCPSRSSLVIEELPSIGEHSGTRIFALSNSCVFSCAMHVNGKKEKCALVNISPKFGFNSLCTCACPLTCAGSEMIVEHANETATISLELFSQCLRKSELCISMLALADILYLSAPPFFNVSLETQVVVADVLGPVSSDGTKEVERMSPILYASLFPPAKPLNSYMMVNVAQHSCKISILVPRDTKIRKRAKYRIEQMLVVDTMKDVLIVGIVLKKEYLTAIDRNDENVENRGSISVKSTQKRQLLLSNRLRMF